jgi:hypothetical protein
LAQRERSASGGRPDEAHVRLPRRRHRKSKCQSGRGFSVGAIRPLCRCSTAGEMSTKELERIEAPPVYHANLGPDAYEPLLSCIGFEVVAGRQPVPSTVPLDHQQSAPLD